MTAHEKPTSSARQFRPGELVLTEHSGEPCEIGDLEEETRVMVRCPNLSLGQRHKWARRDRLWPATEEGLLQKAEYELTR